MHTPALTYLLPALDGHGWDMVRTDTESRDGSPVKPLGRGPWMKPRAGSRETLYRETRRDRSTRFWILSWHPDGPPRDFKPRWITDEEAERWMTANGPA